MPILRLPFPRILHLISIFSGVQWTSFVVKILLCRCSAQKTTSLCFYFLLEFRELRLQRIEGNSSKKTETTLKAVSVFVTSQKIQDLVLERINYLVYNEMTPLASFNFNSESERLTISWVVVTPLITSVKLLCDLE